ncbi:8-oxo-dGTP diphosphatase [Candidatus Marsarchaeota archaeon]|nr:8-oxo-dGTP diphosphatase [Candidatus Marsarchaeota archaeon]MCL5404402.1 8-oxo-dGTP diphosphatase [Candidatus Marsarchaeota archaeon]
MESDTKLEQFIRSYPNLRDVTLCYFVDKSAGRILLAMKKRGFGSGKYNGLGGKVKAGETVEEAMVREAEEESHSVPERYEKAGVINFYFDYPGKEAELNQRVHVYLVYEWRGEPAESEEMKPEWVGIGKIPLGLMWDDDKYWLPQILQGKSVEAYFLMDALGKVKDAKINYTRKK